MSMHIVGVVHWHGDVFFITDTDEVWRVWINHDFLPSLERIIAGPNDPFVDYSWPVAHLRGLKRGKATGSLSGIARGDHHFQGSNFNPRGWGRR